MPKETKISKTSAILRHSPLGNELQQPKGKLRVPKLQKSSDDEEEDMDVIPKSIQEKIQSQAREQRVEMSRSQLSGLHDSAADDGSEFDENYDDEDDEQLGSESGEDLVEIDGDYVDGTGLTQDEEDVVQRFLQANHNQNRSLADIIMDRIKEKEHHQQYIGNDDGMLPPKVIEVYSAVGKLLKHYTSGKLPKALKMIPHLKNWEDVLWITRPDEWSPIATYACTRIFVSNLNERMAQRFLNVILLEKCREDIRVNRKLNYHYYMALKKGLFKPAAFYKGIILPLAQSRTCTLREAAIIGSVLAKVSIAANHSAAALLRLAEMAYSGSTSMFLKVLLNKKYALPRRVLDAVVTHFASFEKETRQLPVLWHQSLLVFAQRYKLELSDGHRERLRTLLRTQNHHQISQEVRRELFQQQSNIESNQMQSSSSSISNSLRPTIQDMTMQTV